MEKLPLAKIKLNKKACSLTDILEKSIRSAQSLADAQKIGIVSDDLERSLTPASKEADSQESTLQPEDRPGDAERRAEKTERRSLRAERRWLDAEGRPLRKQLPPEGERRGLDGDRRGSDRRDEDRPGDLFHDDERSSDVKSKSEEENQELAPGDTLNVDPDKIMLVVGNLLGNAIKVSKPGDTIRIDTRNIDGTLEIAVIATGYYEQAPSTGQGDPAALGIAICKAIIEAHGGTIGVDSSSKLSKFWFRLPSSCLQ